MDTAVLTVFQDCIRIFLSRMTNNALKSLEIRHGNHNNILLPAGTHQYHFNFLLPSDAKMPTSFEHGPNCNIRYEIKAIINRNENDTNCIRTKTFTVLECIDINQPSLTVRL